jgi:hypothetical protein
MNEHQLIYTIYFCIQLNISMGRSVRRLSENDLRQREGLVYNVTIRNGIHPSSTYTAKNTCTRKYLENSKQLFLSKTKT